MNTIFETSIEHKSTSGNSNQFPFANDQIEQLLRLLKSPHDSNLPLCSFPYQAHMQETRKIKVAKESFSAIAEKGEIRISLFLKLKNVLQVPRLSCNLLPVGKLTNDHNCRVNFSPFHCVFQDLASRKTIGSARLNGEILIQDPFKQIQFRIVI